MGSTPKIHITYHKTSKYIPPVLQEKYGAAFLFCHAFVTPHVVKRDIDSLICSRTYQSKIRKVIIMNWKNMPLSHKISTVIAGLAVVVWLLNKVQPNLFPVDPTYPAIAVFTICEAAVCWEKQRKWSFLLIAGAVISLAFFLLELILL